MVTCGQAVALTVVGVVEKVVTRIVVQTLMVVAEKAVTGMLEATGVEIAAVTMVGVILAGMVPAPLEKVPIGMLAAGASMPTVPRVSAIQLSEHTIVTAFRVRPFRRVRNTPL